MTASSYARQLARHVTARHTRPVGTAAASRQATDLPKGRRSDLDGACSRRINIQHRLVYQVVEDQQVVKVLRMWSHYEVG